MNQPALLKTAEVASRLNCSRDKVLELVDNGTLKAVKLGPRTFRVFEDSLQKLLDDHAK